MGLCNSYKVLVSALLLVGGIAILSNINVDLAQAKSSTTGSQPVAPPDCSVPDSCIVAPPTIYNSNKIARRPVLQGTYDSAYSQILRIKFNGIIYTLGVDSQLTARNGEWKLSLDSLSHPLPNGTYIIIVEAVGYTGQLVETSVEVKVEYNPPVRPDDNDDDDTIGGSDGDHDWVQAGPGSFYPLINQLDGSAVNDNFNLNAISNSATGYRLGDDVRPNTPDWLWLVVAGIITIGIMLLAVYHRRITLWLRHRKKDDES